MTSVREISITVKWAENENELVFLNRAVQAAVCAYRKNCENSVIVKDDDSRGNKPDEKDLAKE